MGRRRPLHLTLDLPPHIAEQTSALLELARRLLEARLSSVRSSPTAAPAEEENGQFDPVRFAALAEAETAQLRAVSPAERAVSPTAADASPGTEAISQAAASKHTEAPWAPPYTGDAFQEESPGKQAGKQEAVPLPPEHLPPVNEAFGEGNAAAAELVPPAPAAPTQEPAGSPGHPDNGAPLSPTPSVSLPEAAKQDHLPSEPLTGQHPAPLTAEAVNLAFRRDDRRYDNGFPLY